MGAAGSLHIDQFKNACQIHKCTQNVTGLRSRGKSPSDQWILSLRPGTMFHHQQIECCFLKYWIERKGSIYIKSLNYELWVYKHVIYPLVRHRVSPNFSQFLASGKNCTFGDVLSIARKAENFHVNQLHRNIDYLRVDPDGEDRGARPAIHEGPRTAIQGSKAFEGLKFRMLIIEFLKGPTLETFLEGKPGIESLWPILLQISIACYALFLSKTTHGDLHAGNIIVLEAKKVEFFTFQVNEHEYSLPLRFVVKIFDFDRAFTARYKDHPLMTQQLRELDEMYDVSKSNEKELYEAQKSLLNVIRQSEDICTIIAEVYKKSKKGKHTELLDVLFHKHAPADVKQSKKWMNNPHLLSAQWYAEHIKPLPDIIQAISLCCDLQNQVPDSKVYNCSADLFHDNGTLKENVIAIEKMEALRQRIANLEQGRAELEERNKTLTIENQKALERERDALALLAELKEKNNTLAAENQQVLEKEREALARLSQENREKLALTQDNEHQKKLLLYLLAMGGVTTGVAALLGGQRGKNQEKKISFEQQAKIKIKQRK